MKYIYKVVIGITFFLATGCEDQLEIPNPNQPTAEIFYDNEEDAIQSVNSIYSRNTSTAISRWLPWLGNLRADQLRSESPDNSLVNNYDRFLITDYNFHQFYAIWNDLYVIIYRSNQVLDNVPEIDMNEELKSRLLGEAKYLRGWAYYHLALYWGNVPLMLETSSPTDRPANSTQEEVWDQAISDFEDATETLWTKEEYPPEQLGRATKGAAHAMLGKTYMMQEEYEQAIATFDWLINGQGASIYGLTENYQDNFLPTTENNMESVYELQFAENPLETHEDDVSQNADQLNYGTSIAPFMAPQPIGFSDIEVLEWVVDEFDEQTVEGERDPRVEASFLYDSTDVRGPDYTDVYGMAWSERYPDPNSELYNKIYLRKFLNDAVQDYENFRSPNNYRNIRYADVLLLFAEALNQLGRTGEAYEYVNRVRERANLPPLEEAHPEIGTDQGGFLEQLKHERITELAGEGHRWADLARWGDLGPELSERDPGFANFEEGRHELLPIPQQDIDYNPNLTQNPNW